MNKAVQEISFLVNEVHILNNQLWLNDSLLAEVLDIAEEQSQALAQLHEDTAKLSQTLSQLSVSALQDDMVPWDSRCAPQSCSTSRTSRSVVQICGRPNPLQEEGPPPAPIPAPVPLHAEESSAMAVFPPPATERSTLRRRLLDDADDAVRSRSSTCLCASFTPSCIVSPEQRYPQLLINSERSSLHSSHQLSGL